MAGNSRMRNSSRHSALTRTPRRPIPQPTGEGTMDATATFAMWAIMMVAMMLPSVAPTIIAFAAVQRRSKSALAAAADAMLFAAGYFVLWTLFSLVATAAQWALADAQLLSPEMTTTSALLGAALFIAAGGYQFTALKAGCLSRCRAA